MAELRRREDPDRSGQIGVVEEVIRLGTEAEAVRARRWRRQFAVRAWFGGWTGRSGWKRAETELFSEVELGVEEARAVAVVDRNDLFAGQR